MSKGSSISLTGQGRFGGPFVVWTAPTLLAEVMVDGLVMSRIFKRMNLRGGAYWASGVLKRTWLPALLAVLFFGFAGFALQRIVPTADSIGLVIQCLLGRAG